MCIVERYQRRKGWMFWGCFHGDIKGPGVFWAKEWGSINAARYREKIIPIVEGWLRLNKNAGNELIFMQDSAPAHMAALTTEDLRERGIHYAKWPSFSPDLNSIEKVWNWMKDWIQDHYDDTLLRWDELREAVEAAWDALPATYLPEELSKVPARCQAVIDANGMHTRY
jgi:transposase